MKKVMYNTKVNEMFYNKLCNVYMRPIADMCEKLCIDYDWSEYNNKDIYSSDMIYIKFNDVCYMRIQYILDEDYYYVRDTGFCYGTDYKNLVEDIYRKVGYEEDEA